MSLDCNGLKRFRGICKAFRQAGCYPFASWDHSPIPSPNMGTFPRRYGGAYPRSFAYLLTTRPGVGVADATCARAHTHVLTPRPTPDAKRVKTSGEAPAQSPPIWGNQSTYPHPKSSLERKGFQVFRIAKHFQCCSTVEQDGEGEDGSAVDRSKTPNDRE